MKRPASVAAPLAEAVARVTGRGSVGPADRRRVQDAGWGGSGRRPYVTDDAEELRWTCR